MLKINDRIVDIGKFPDGTLLIKETPGSTDEQAHISWFFENNEELVALIYLVGHLRSHGIEDIVLYMPYVPNARQDRVKYAHDVFTLVHFAKIINSLRFSKVIVLDPHSYVSEALIDNVHVVRPDGYIRKVYDKVNTDGMILFYPDEGAMKRYSGILQKPYAFGIKERDWSTGQIRGLTISASPAAIRGHDIMIVDDICSRGGTFYHSAKKLKECGAGKIFLYVTHCENTILEGDLLSSGLIDRVYTTNSIFTKNHDKIEVIEL